MSSNEQLYELMAMQATDILRPEDARRLDRLLGSEPDVDPEGFERAAAAIHEALSGPGRALPSALRDRLLLASPPTPAAASGAETTRPASNIAWWAAAAALLIALAGWWPRFAPPNVPTESVGTEARPADRRAGLLEMPESLTLAWSATKDPAATGAGGDVVWNNDLQQGYMRFSGLEANDPAVSQYQLWIFDRQRGERYPVDGGVFDVPAGDGAVLVPITAKIRVGEPYLFAVTVERPGGVVVSERERIVLVAQPT